MAAQSVKYKSIASGKAYEDRDKECFIGDEVD